MKHSDALLILVTGFPKRICARRAVVRERLDRGCDRVSVNAGIEYSAVRRSLLLNEGCALRLLGYRNRP